MRIYSAGGSEDELDLGMIVRVLLEIVEQALAVLSENEGAGLLLGVARLKSTQDRDL